MTTATFSHPAQLIRASDADRERAFGYLRAHWLAGRLSLEEYEERCDEAVRARFVDDLRRSIRELPYPLPEHRPAAPALAPPPPSPAGAAASLVLGTLSLLGVVMSFGMLFILTLPASTWAWSLGRRTRRASRGAAAGIATIGEAFGIVATVIGCLALTACGFLIASN